MPQNPEDSTSTLQESLQDIDSFFKKFPIRYQVINCSTILEGIEKSEGRFVFCLNSYLSTPLVEVFQSLQTFHESTETQFIFGDRTHAKKKPRGTVSTQQIIFEKLIRSSLPKNFQKSDHDLFCPYIALQISQKENVIKLLQQNHSYYFLLIKLWAIQNHIPYQIQNIHWQHPPFQQKWRDLLKVLLLLRRRIF